MRCRKASRTKAGWQKVLAADCAPFVAGEFSVEESERSRIHDSHSLWLAEAGVIWCSRCGGHAEKLVKLLAEQ
eukprot:11189814-Lingulodinium_polyedra.AAC.1